MPSSPHDLLFKKTLSIAQNAEGELRAMLPPELAAQVDWATLKTERGSFVDAEAREWHTDLLFSAELSGRQALLYLLLEHQSTVDAWMPLRMLTYMTRIWAERREAGATRLPVIVPLVLHHSETGWTASRRFVELVDADADLLSLVHPFVPAIELLVDDLSRVPEVELLRRAMTAMARVALWALRSQRVGHDAALLAQWVEELERARATAGREAIEVFFVYLSAVEGGEDLLKAILDADVSQDVREVAMGLRQKWEAEAEVRGEARGEARGQRKKAEELLVKLLHLRFGTLPSPAAARIRDASMEELDRWAERVLAAATLEQIFE
ncbi:MAG: Rpn family recombination-promoting nuclease/putative transposase [Sandaracinaceae bacterium]|nr:Rpn family recombination-promoting nuclease/putative transposase [Sandaracinaceae bacterium]